MSYTPPVPPRPHVPGENDDQNLAAMWAQMGFGRGLTGTQALHLFHIGFRAGRDSEHGAWTKAVEIMTAGEDRRRWRRMLARLRGHAA